MWVLYSVGVVESCWRLGAGMVEGVDVACVNSWNVACARDPPQLVGSVGGEVWAARLKLVRFRASISEHSARLRVGNIAANSGSCPRAIR